MRHVLLALLAACGGADGLEISGDIALTVGMDTITPTVGAAIRDTDPTKALIVIGTRDISCDTKLESPLRKGTYVTMVIDRAAGTQTAATITVVRVESSGTLFNGDTGEVVIDVFEDRVVGSVNFMTQDQTDEVITDLAAVGTFDVTNCAP
jgi:hypothetical protein